MTTIEIDFDVYKALTARRASESTTYNDILREMCGLTPAQVSDTSTGGCVFAGVHFPERTQLRATYKGREFFAEVNGGAVVFNGERYTSLSAAAQSITKGGVNGWWFWQVKRPTEPEWRPAGELRG